MKIGTYYYPEQWPTSDWERDFDRIAEMGLKIVHMAEFAWFALEPTTGNFAFDWLDRCIDLAEERGLDVILCTPTAAPPIWLSEQYPEVLPVDKNGFVERHGGRRHYTPTSPRMLEASYNIVRAMGLHFGSRRSVIGWQIDNELGHWFDQSAATHEAFRKWLRKKYINIEELNRAWGAQFWNQYYTGFDEILMPPSRDCGYGNPHQHLDASRFWSQCWADFVKLQADLLRPVIEERFITTNFMPFFLDCDPGQMKESLSLYSWDSYPVSGWSNEFGGENFRLGDPASIEFNHDQMASYTGRWALLELQPGTINWSGVPVRLPPGAVRLWMWTAIGHGVEFITVYRFRQPRFGVEQWHDGLVSLDGQSLSPGGEQWSQVAAEVAKLWPRSAENIEGVGVRSEVDSKEVVKASGVEQSNRGLNNKGVAFNAKPSEEPQLRAGLVLDYDQLWNFATLPQAKRWNQSELLCQYHGALSRMGYRVTILRPDDAIAQSLDMVVAPGMQLVDDNLLNNWKNYVDGGGNLLLTCRTGLQDRTGQFFERAYGSAITSLTGSRVTAYDGLPATVNGGVSLDQTLYRWNIWADQIETVDEGTQVWAHYTDMFYAGAAAITHRACAKGSVTYVGLFGDRSLTDAVVEKLSRKAENDRAPLPDRVRVLRRDGLTIALNYNDKPVKLNIPSDAERLIGQDELPAAGVTVWREKK